MDRKFNIHFSFENIIPMDPSSKLYRNKKKTLSFPFTNWLCFFCSKSPYQRVHPIYEQLIQKQHTKVMKNSIRKYLFFLQNPNKEHYDQRIQVWKFALVCFTLIANLCDFVNICRFVFAKQDNNKLPQCLYYSRLVCEFPYEEYRIYFVFFFRIHEIWNI